MLNPVISEMARIRANRLVQTTPPSATVLKPIVSVVTCTGLLYDFSKTIGRNNSTHLFESTILEPIVSVVQKIRLKQFHPPFLTNLFRCYMHM